MGTFYTITMYSTLMLFNEELKSAEVTNQVKTVGQKRLIGGHEIKK